MKYLYMVLQKCCAGISLIFTLFWTSGSENVEKLCIIKFEGIIVYLIHNIILKAIGGGSGSKKSCLVIFKDLNEL